MTDLFTALVGLWPIGPSLAALFLFFDYYQTRKHTPSDVYKKARKSKNPIIEVERKDGTIELVNCDYASGGAYNEEYGMFLVDSDGVKAERRSGARVLHVSEGSGFNVKGQKHLEVIRALKEQYNAQNYNDILQLLNLWRKCDNKECDFEGVFTPETIPEKDGEKAHIAYKCPGCGAVGGLMLEPPLFLEPLRNVEMGWAEKYFKEMQNPIANKIKIDEMVANIKEKEKGLPLKTITILAMLGIMFVMVAIGGLILYNGVVMPAAAAAADVAAKAAAASPPALAG